MNDDQQEVEIRSDVRAGEDGGGMMGSGSLTGGGTLGSGH